MKQAILPLLFITFSSELSFARSIYGADDRLEVFESKNKKHQKIAKSVAAQIPNKYIKVEGKLSHIIAPTILKDRNLCSNERYLNQINAASCTGTLIAPNLLVTAAHCFEMSDEDSCLEQSWVFDYQAKTAEQTEFSVPSGSVYKCKSVLSRNLDTDLGVDYAIVELDRPVTNRKPIKVRSKGTIAVGTPLVLIGFPNGVPMKVAEGGSVLSHEFNSFKTNMDAYVGNSGAGVFNAETGDLEGILSSGNQDYRFTEDGCYQSQVYAEEAGEEIVMDVKDINEYVNSVKKSSFLNKIFSKKSK